MPPIANPRVIQLKIASARNADARICTGQCGVTNAMLMAERKTSGANSATMPHAPKNAVLRVCRTRVFIASAYTARAPGIGPPASPMASRIARISSANANGFSSRPLHCSWARCRISASAA